MRKLSDFVVDSHRVYPPTIFTMIFLQAPSSLLNKATINENHFMCIRSAKFWQISYSIVKA